MLPHKNTVSLIGLAAMALLSLFLTFSILALVSTEKIRLQTSQVGVEYVDGTFPWKFNGVTMQAKAIIEYETGYFTPTRWRLIPDDHLEKLVINGQDVDLEPFGKAVRDYSKGILLDVSPYAKAGNLMRLEVNLKNGGGPGGLNFTPIYPFGFWFFLALAFIPFLIVVGRYFSLTKEQKILLLLALIPITFYWSQTPWSERAYDVNGVGGHFDYIRYLVDNLRIPAAQEGWIFYQPPYYYLLSAPFYSIAETFDVSKHEFVRVFGLMLWFIFLAASLGALKNVLACRYQSILVASAIVVFWPSGIMHSVTLGNDILFYCFCGIAFFQLSIWLNEQSLKNVSKLALAAGAAFLAKNNGLLLIGGMGIIVFISFVQQNSLFQKKSLSQILAYGCISLLLLLIGYYKRIAALISGGEGNLLVGNGGNLHHGLLIDNSFKSYIPMDLVGYFINPYTSAWSNELGRNNFWNYLLKTSYTGEFSFSGQWLASVAIFMGITGLALWCTTFAGIFTGAKQVFSVRPLQCSSRRDVVLWPWAILGGIFLVGAAAFRYTMPFSCSNDFRYILPVIVIVGLMGGKFKGAHIWSLLFVLVSIVFFLLIPFVNR